MADSKKSDWIYEHTLKLFAGGRSAAAMSNDERRARYGGVAAWFSIIGNALLFILKFIVGTLINSISLIADSFHTLSDVVTSVVVVLGFRISGKAPDEGHPFGHGRIEHIATIIIAVLLFVVAFEFMLSSAERLVAPPPVITSALAIAVVVFAVFFKEYMARFSIYVGRKINSQALIADAWHHRSDALAALFVLVALIGTYAGFPLLDPIGGILVSLTLFYVGFSLIRTSSNFLMGEKPQQSFVDEITRCASAVPGVSGVHHVEVHDYGTRKAVSLHLLVSDTMTAEAAHDIADDVERKIADCIEGVASTVVHIEPRSETPEVRERRHAERDKPLDAITKILLKNKDVIAFHKLRIIGTGSDALLSVHVFISRGMTIEETHALEHELKKEFAKEFDGRLRIHFEPCTEECSACETTCKKKGSA